MAKRARKEPAQAAPRPEPVQAREETNFDVWRSSIRPEDMLRREMCVDGFLSEPVFALGCGRCPLDCKNGQTTGDYPAGSSCGERFLEWARFSAQRKAKEDAVAKASHDRFMDAQLRELKGIGI
jgi:hypothetical protein